MFARRLIYANLTLKGGGNFSSIGWVRVHFFLTRLTPTVGKSLLVFSNWYIKAVAAKAGDEPYILDTPFQILPFYYPFSLLSNPTHARALFTLILELALFALAILSLLLTEWESPRVFALLFIFFARLQLLYVSSHLRSQSRFTVGTFLRRHLVRLSRRNG